MLGRVSSSQSRFRDSSPSPLPGARAEQATIRSDGLEKQVQARLSNRVPCRTTAVSFSRRTICLPCLNEPALKRPMWYGIAAAAMGHDDLERREVVEHRRVEQRNHRDAFFVDEVQRITEPARMASSRVDLTRNVQFDQLFI